MKRIGFFYAYAIGNVTYRESFGNAAVRLCDYDAFEVLDSFLAALDDSVTDLNRVTYFELGNFGFHAFSVDSFDNSFHFRLYLRNLRNVHNPLRDSSSRPIKKAAERSKSAIIIYNFRNFGKRFCCVF